MLGRGARNPPLANTQINTQEKNFIETSPKERITNFELRSDNLWKREIFKFKSKTTEPINIFINVYYFILKCGILYIEMNTAFRLTDMKIRLERVHHQLQFAYCTYCQQALEGTHIYKSYSTNILSSQYFPVGWE